ncbi:hypothetical protein HK100_003989 [Physocladia obscura]|uniref:Homeobox domain-containing protein n=1 Tax=Physocladia obscura TaxID=109957 RepID=A0AAD5STP7_9FUNG|nr:hypothetical protein HK100_003989 [Physocladia obscura]
MSINMNMNMHDDASLVYMMDRRYSVPAMNMRMSMNMHPGMQPQMQLAHHGNHQLHPTYTDNIPNGHSNMNNELLVSTATSESVHPLLAPMSPVELSRSSTSSVTQSPPASATPSGFAEFSPRVSMSASIFHPSMQISQSVNPFLSGQSNSGHLFASPAHHQESFSQMQQFQEWDIAMRQQHQHHHQQQQQQQQNYINNSNAHSHQILRNQPSFSFPGMLPQSDSQHSSSPASSRLSIRSRSASLEMPVSFQTAATISSFSATQPQIFRSEGNIVAEPIDEEIGSMEPGMELVLSCSALSPASVLARRASVDNMSKPLRFKPTEKEFALMSEIFQKNPFPSVALRNKLAEKMSVDVKQVQFWFQNKRQTLKVNGVYVLKPTKRRLSGSSSTLKKRPSLSPLSAESMYFFVESGKAGKTAQDLSF